MKNDYLKKRLRGILDLFKAIRSGSIPLSNESKGEEREAFLNAFLLAVLPSRAKIGRGEITDLNNERSGQLDCVVEYGYQPSLPLLPMSDTRLFIAESIAAVIEVKSDLSSQWSQIQKTATAVSKLKRSFGKTHVTNDRIPGSEIPFLAVGYQGWKNIDKLREHFNVCPALHGILDLECEQLIAKIPFRKEDGSTWVLDYGASAEDALWGFACILSEQVNSLLMTDALASDYTFK
jgi:hypothetical protein